MTLEVTSSNDICGKMIITPQILILATSKLIKTKFQNAYFSFSWPSKLRAQNDLSSDTTFNSSSLSLHHTSLNLNMHHSVSNKNAVMNIREFIKNPNLPQKR